MPKMTKELQFLPSFPHTVPPPLTNICSFPDSSIHDACVVLQLHSGCLAWILASTQNFLGYIWYVGKC